MKRIILQLILLSNFAYGAMPLAVPDGNIEHFQLLEKYKNGELPTKENLEGRWIEVVRSVSSKCATISINQRNKINNKGLKNLDDSVREMEFINMVTKKNEFLETEEQEYTTVNLLNLGSENNNQGPFIVNLRNGQFSQYAYVDSILDMVKNYSIDKFNYAFEDSQSISHNTYFNYSCRLVENSQTKLICSLRLQGQLSRSQQNKCREENGHILIGFRKVR